MAKVYLNKIDSIHLKKVQKMSLLLLFGKNKVDFCYIIVLYSYILMSGKYKSKFTESFTTPLMSEMTNKK